MDSLFKAVHLLAFLGHVYNGRGKSLVKAMRHELHADDNHYSQKDGARSHGGLEFRLLYHGHVVEFATLEVREEVSAGMSLFAAISVARFAGISIDRTDEHSSAACPPGLQRREPGVIGDCGLALGLMTIVGTPVYK